MSNTGRRARVYQRGEYLPYSPNITKSEGEKVKQASRGFLAKLEELLKPMHHWTQNTATRAEVRIFIIDNLLQTLPLPPFTEEDTVAISDRVFDYLWQKGVAQPGQSLAQ